MCIERIKNGNDEEVFDLLLAASLVHFYPALSYTAHTLNNFIYHISCNNFTGNNKLPCHATLKSFKLTLKNFNLFYFSFFSLFYFYCFPPTNNINRDLHIAHHTVNHHLLSSSNTHTIANLSPR